MSIDKQERNTTSGEVTSERVSAEVTSETVTSERVSERVSEGVSFSVSWADLPTVLISCICFVTYIALGFFVSAIGELQWPTTSLTHSPTQSLMYALFLTYTCLLSIPLYHFFTRLLTHSLTHTHSIYMHFCFHSCLHILTYLLTYLLTHSHTHSLTHCHYSGAAIPEIADDLNRENTSLSIIYTARGVGFFIGTFFGTAQNELPVFKLIRTDVLVCIPTLVVALGSFILFILPLKLWVILVVVCVQAAMFSFLDVVANIMLMELWGKRVEVR